MEETVYYKQRQEGYAKVLEEIKNGNTGRTDFENAIKERTFRWWANWKPDYEGWLECADGFYAKSCVIDAIGSTPQIYQDYRASMKFQRDAFIMDMGAIDNCVVEGDTVAISYLMYLTAKADMGELKAGMTMTLKVTEFNKFAKIEGYDDPMVVYLLLTSCGK